MLVKVMLSRTYFDLKFISKSQDVKVIREHARQ